MVKPRGADFGLGARATSPAMSAQCEENYLMLSLNTSRKLRAWWRVAGEGARVPSGNVQ